MLNSAMTDMTESLFAIEDKSRVDILAGSSDGLQLELVKSLDDRDSEMVIRLSELPGGCREGAARMNAGSVRKYFHFPNTFPFLARFRGKPVGYAVGITLESLNKESWVRCDGHWGAGDTVYIHSFFMHPKFEAQNYSRILLNLCMAWIGRRGFQYISVHQRPCDAARLFPAAEAVASFPNWQNSGEDYDYIRMPVS